MFEELIEAFNLLIAFKTEESQSSIQARQTMEESTAQSQLFAYENAAKKPEIMENPQTPTGNYIKYMKECMHQHPLNAIESLHKYFHTIPSQVKKSQEKTIQPPKMHYASLNLACLHFRVGRFDEALLSTSILYLPPIRYCGDH